MKYIFDEKLRGKCIYVRKSFM
ncbi:rCG59082 [Rattus norvegicus]|uniref:RCG59082 n=1 Tax=Rattus norvegicus TaxID=10116 RepID=A6JPS2_RAT|nr:rCG59082 [Rattus norvegicus]